MLTSIFPLVLYLCMFSSVLGTSDLVPENRFEIATNCLSVFAPNHSACFLAGKNLQNQDLSLCSISRVARKKEIVDNIEPLAPEKITLDYKKDIDNPLHTDSLRLLTLLDTKPLVVTEKEPSTLLYYTSFGKETTAFSSSPLHDADGNSSHGIVKLKSNLAFSSGSKRFTNFIIAAVKKQDSVFGVEGSGFALVKVDSYKEEVEIEVEPEQKNSNTAITEPKKVEQTRLFLNALDAANGTDKGNKAVGLWENKYLFSVNDGLDTFVENAVDMHWDARFGKCYCVMQGTTKKMATADQGINMLVCGTIADDKLLFQSVVNHAALSEEDTNIVGVKGANKAISLHKVRTLYTSTSLPYLVVVGGNGNPATTKRTVSALPLSMKPEGDSIASKFSKIETNYRGKPSIVFDNRQFTDKAESADQMPSYTDVAVSVGGGSKLQSDIQDISIVQDAVYVTVEYNSIEQEAGIYHSQAIFDATGAIAAWTPWKKVLVSHGSIEAMDFNPADGSFTILEKKDGICTRRTNWQSSLSSDSFNLATIFTQSFEQSRGGVQGLFDIASDHQALKQSSLLVGTGYEKVLIAQTGLVEHNVCKGLREPVVLDFNDSALQELGPITAATIMCTTRYAWLCVGGYNGLAILSNADGSGWDSTKGLTHGLPELQNMTFKKIGDFSYIQKLIACDEKLYVVSQSKIESIALENNATIFGEKKCLADGLNFGFLYPVSFNDALLSNQYGILATSHGLFIRNFETDNEWNRIKLPVEGEEVVQLFVLSPTGFETGFAKKAQIYVLTNSVHEKSRVYRFFSDQGTFVQVPDHFKKHDGFDYFCNLSKPAAHFVTDGSFYIYTQHDIQQAKTELMFLPEDIAGGKAIQYNASKRALITKTTSENISAITRNSATGQWMIAGDFGLRITQ